MSLITLSLTVAASSPAVWSTMVVTAIGGNGTKRDHEWGRGNAVR